MGHGDLPGRAGAGELGLFRALGRVEWAWVAAPLIAVVCTVTVIRLAQLDIGFVRLQTEVAVAEIQGDYPRADVTRYDALYTSLTTYLRPAMRRSRRGVLPFPAVGRPGQFQHAVWGAAAAS